jgi:hypothetical protein
VDFSKAWSDLKYVQGTAVHPSTNLIHLKFRENKLDVQVNGESVVQDHAPNARMRIRPENFLVGVGAQNEGDDTTVRYHNLRIRKVAN